MPTALRPRLQARAGAGRDEQGRAEAGRGGDSSMGGALGAGLGQEEPGEWSGGLGI